MNSIGDFIKDGWLSKDWSKRALAEKAGISHSEVQMGTRKRSSLNDEEYGVLEVEVHYFAIVYLAPATMVKKIPYCKTVQGIMGICYVSEDAAIHRLDELRQL